MPNYSFVPVSNLQIFYKDRLFLRQFHRRVADDTGCTDMDLKQPNESGYLLVIKIVSETKIIWSLFVFLSNKAVKKNDK